MASVQAAVPVVGLDPTSTTENKSSVTTNKFNPSKAALQTEYIDSGAGYFTSKFSFSEESIKFISPRAIESVKSIPVKVGDTFTIADYGCADGSTSMQLMYACVRELRSLYGNELEVHINYEDKPDNDFKSLFYFLQGSLPAPTSYLTDFPDVYVSATGTNFYDQCFPSGFVNFGFCFFAAQWLSQKPCNLTKAVLHCLSEVPDERNEFGKQAEKDWERFLLMRARELSKVRTEGNDAPGIFQNAGGTYKAIHVRRFSSPKSWLDTCFSGNKRVPVARKEAFARNWRRQNSCEIYD